MRPALLLLLAACTANPPAPPAEPESAPSSETDSRAPRADAAPKEAASSAQPLPAGRLPPNAEPVSLAGYGVRIQLRPPFQAARLGSTVQGGGPDSVVWSWWDTTAPKAGQHGDAGLHNIEIVPRPPPKGGATLRTYQRGDPPITVIQLGQEGTEIRLPEGFNHLGGAGAVEAGPARLSWTIDSGDASEPIPDGPLLHSTDPAEGAAFAFLRTPKRPWGAWPE